MRSIKRHPAHRPPSALRLTTLALVFLSGLSACEDRGGARRAELQSVLIEENLPLLYREPELTRAKFRKMAGGLYPFLRGTAGLFLHDMMQPGAYPTRYATPESSQVLIIGDAHPENLGTYRNAEGELFFDYNDFDGAAYGPYHFEVRRLAFSFAVTALEILGQGHDKIDLAAIEEAVALAAPIAEAYLVEIDRLLRGEEPVAVREHEGFGPIVDDLFERAREGGRVRAELNEFSRETEEGRRLYEGILRHPQDGYPSRELWPISEREEQLVRALLAQWPASIHDPSLLNGKRYQLIDAKRRIGAGVSSFPILRYYALLQNEGDQDDYLILDIKEGRDGSEFPMMVRYPARVFTHNAERSVLLQRQFQEFPDADPLLGYVREGALSFRVQDTSEYQKGVKLDRIVANIRAGDWSMRDLERFGVVAAQILARGHTRGELIVGGSMLEAIGGALREDPYGFVDEVEEFTRRYIPRFLEDYRLFLSLIEERGDDLGFGASMQK